MVKNLPANAGDVRDAGLDMTEATWHVHMKGIRFENFEKLQRNQSCLIFATPWTVASQAPLSMDSPDKNTGVGCHSLLQGIILTQGSNLGLLHCRQILYHLSH